MKQIISNYLNMVSAVLANLNEHRSEWENDPQIAAEVAALEKTYETVSGASVESSGIIIKAQTEAINVAFDHIITVVIKLCKKLCVYARQNNDNLMFALAHHSRHSLSNGMRLEAIERCEAIVNKASSIINQLQPYKVTTEELANVTKLIDTYKSHTDKRSTLQADKVLLTKDVTNEVDTLRNHLTILDEMIEGFLTNEDFIAHYFVTRNVRNYGKSKTKSNQPSI